ncbi:MAG TPA: glycosyltransferase family 2 protein [Vicinamibacteria bacterium]|nr:glycosyltransferase family 2 protein [Vicinamibacteria bacterium]
MSCSIVIVSFNTRPLTLACLDSVHRSAGVSIQTIVVDNASEDGSADAIEGSHPGVRLLRNRENLGFARAVNQGLACATSSVVLLLNSDAILEEGTVSKLVEVLEAHSEIGAVGPWVVSPHGALQHHCASREHSLAGQLLWHFRLSPGKPYLAEEIGPHGTRRTERLSGAALAVRRNVIDRVGLLDERFFLYFEDADWVLRIRRAGFLAGCVTEARVTHAMGASARANPLMRLMRSVHSVRSELAYFEKHHGPWRTFLLRTGILVSSGLRAVSLDAIRALLPGERYRLVADLRAIGTCLHP